MPRSEVLGTLLLLGAAFLGLAAIPGTVGAAAEMPATDGATFPGTPGGPTTPEAPPEAPPILGATGDAGERAVTPDVSLLEWSSTPLAMDRNLPQDAGREPVRNLPVPIIGDPLGRIVPT